MTWYYVVRLDIAIRETPTRYSRYVFLGKVVGNSHVRPCSSFTCVQKSLSVFVNLSFLSLSVFFHSPTAHPSRSSRITDLGLARQKEPSLTLTSAPRFLLLVIIFLHTLFLWGPRFFLFLLCRMLYFSWKRRRWSTESYPKVSTPDGVSLEWWAKDEQGKGREKN